MRISSLLLVVSSLALAVFAGCAGPQTAHFFPRMRPLFSGLDETGMNAEAQAALAEAKADFQLAKRGQEPRHASYVDTLPHTQSKVYQGRGYRLTKVRDHAFYAHSDGAEIVIEPRITGGKPYRYDEVDEVVD